MDQSGQNWMKHSAALLPKKKRNDCKRRKYSFFFSIFIVFLQDIYSAIKSNRLIDNVNETCIILRVLGVYGDC